MGRAYDFVVAGVLTMIAIIIHLVSVELFSPDKPLYGIATDGTQVMNGAARAAFWSEFLIVWMPLAVVATAMTWVFIREFRRQVQTATSAPRP